MNFLSYNFWLNFFKKYTVVFRFILVGGLATIIEFISIFVLVEFFNFWYLSATSFSFALGLVISFFLQKIWTFRDKDWRKVNKQASVFLTIRLLNLFFNINATYYLVEIWHVWYFLAAMLAASIFASISFFIHCIFIFDSQLNKKLAKEVFKELHNAFKFSSK